MKKNSFHFPDLLFWDEAIKEWHNLDGHQKKFVSKALQRISESGATIGEALGSKHSIDLTGFRKVKLRKLGIRIVYKVGMTHIEITEIIAIGSRADEEVYQDAYERIIKKRIHHTKDNAPYK